MNLNDIKQFFESAALQSKEEVIVASIINCQRTIDNLKGNRTKIVQLFESVSGVNLQNQTNFGDEDILSLSDYHGNIYAYLNGMRGLLENHIPFDSSLLDNQDILSFSSDLLKEIKFLDKMNDFDKLDALPDYVVKTKLWAKAPINVLGFNILDVNKIEQAINVRELYSIVYNKSMKQLLFVGDGNIICYDIKTDRLDYHHVVNPEYPELRVNNENYAAVIAEEISNNTVEIYRNLKLKEFKFTDNLYFDNARMQQVAQMNTVKKQRNSLVK